ncbi:hypothetical protein, partial [Adonisia turfae]|uniref:hypothetical protein n=1 Tax=Adonisia turfae TaxID=2950184 RepID=UPI0020299A4E
REGQSLFTVCHPIRITKSRQEPEVWCECLPKLCESAAGTAYLLSLLLKQGIYKMRFRLRV